MSETAEQSPSLAIIAAASAKRTTTVQDTLGRTLTVRRMSVSERLKFLKLVPGSAQQNQLWITNAMVIASVIQIDETPVPPIKDEAGIERLGDQLGDEGLAAASTGLEGLLPKAAAPQEQLSKLGE